MNKFETQPNKQESREKIYPEIRVADVKEGGDLMSLTILMRKAIDGWGTEVMDKDISEAKISNDLIDEFNSFLERSNDETLEWIAFVHKRSPEDRQVVIGRLVEHKNMTEDEAQELFDDFSSFLDRFKEESSSVIDLAESKSSGDIKMKQKSLGVINEDIENAIDFFHPDVGVKEIVLLPTSPITPDEQGSAITIGDKVYIRSSQMKGGGVNRRNIIHEYLHTVINPITDKIELTSEEKDKILNMSSEKLIKQEYKDYSMLNESLIRNYGMGAGEVDGKEAFTEDELGERIMELYKQYIEIRDKESDLSFEDYFLDNYGILFT